MITEEEVLIKNPSIKNTRLVQLLQTLEVEERKDFLNFAQSPFHNSIEAVAKFVALLLHFYPNFDRKGCTKFFIYKEVFNRPFKENQFNQLLTKTCKLLEEFFAYQEFRRDDLAQAKRKRDAFQKRHLMADYSKASRKIEQLLEQEEVRNSQTYLERFQYHTVLFNYGNLKKEEKSHCLRSILENLDNWFVWEKLKWGSTVQNEKKVTTQDYPTFLLKDLMSACPEVSISPTVLSYYEDVFHYFKDAADIDINTLIGNFSRTIEGFEDQEKRSNHIILNNLIGSKLRAGEKKYLVSLLELYKISIRDGIFMVNNKFPGMTFVNIVAIAAACYEFSWARHFIKENKVFLKEHQLDSIHLAESYLLFFQADESSDETYYDEAIQKLLTVTSSKSFYWYRVRILLLRIYYELSSSDPSYIGQALSFATAFKLSIKRRPMNERKANTFTNFITITEKLLKVKQSSREKREDKIRKVALTFEKLRPLFAKDWLLEKLTELQKTRR